MHWYLQVYDKFCWESSIERLIHVSRHGIYFCIQLFLYFYHVLLVTLGNEVYSQTDLPISTRSTYTMQIGATFIREVKIDDHVYSLHINTSSNQIRADQSFELSLSETIKYSDSFISFHVGMQILILIFFLVQLTWQEFCSFVWSAKNDTLIDNQRTV